MKNIFKSCYLEDVLEGPWDDAPLGGGIVDALHGEALAAAGLPVREDGAVVALQHTLGQIQTVSCHRYQTLFSQFLHKYDRYLLKVPPHLSMGGCPYIT